MSTDEMLWDHNRRGREHDECVCDLTYGFSLLWSMTGARAHRVGSTKILSDEMTEKTTGPTHLTCDAEGEHNTGVPVGQIMSKLGHKHNKAKNRCIFISYNKSREERRAIGG